MYLLILCFFFICLFQNIFHTSFIFIYFSFLYFLGELFQRFFQSNKFQLKSSKWNLYFVIILWPCKILQLTMINKIYDLLIFNFGMFNFEWFYQTKEFLKGCTVLQDQGLYLEFNIKDLLLCLFYCFIYVYPRATRDVEGIKDRKDEFTTYAVAWPERTSISPTCAETTTFKFYRLFSNNYRQRQPMKWAPFEDAPRTCAAFPVSRILDDSSTWHETSKTELWATPVSTSSSLARPL